MLKYILDWQVTDFAIHAYNLVSVSLYDTLGKDAVGKQHSFRFPKLCIDSFLLEFM